MLGEIMLSIISALIEEGYKGRVEVRMPWHVSHNVLTYVMPRHKEPTKLYHAFYTPYDKAYKLARENDIDCMELVDYPPENAKTYYPKYTRTKRGQEPKLEKQSPGDNISEDPPKPKSKKTKKKETTDRMMEILKSHVDKQKEAKKS
jgi:hypothetical protein